MLALLEYKKKIRGHSFKVAQDYVSKRDFAAVH